MDANARDRSPTFSKLLDQTKGLSLLKVDSKTGKYQPIEKTLTTKPQRNKGHMLKRTNTAVVETQKLDKTRDDEGNKKINNYLLIKEIGRYYFLSFVSLNIFSEAPLV